MNRKVLIVLFFTLVLTTNLWTQESKRLKEFSTYQTSLTKDDIMRSFRNEVRTYLERYDNFGWYYLVDFKVFYEKDEQDYSWSTSTYEFVHQWGTVYSIFLWISNSYLCVEFCNTSFKSGGQPSIRIDYDTKKRIANMADLMFNESEMVLKMYNDSYSDSSRKAFQNGIGWLRY